jgi:hypothetical protein
VRSETPLSVVIAGAALALVLAVFVDWEAGLIVLGVDLLVAALLRLALPDVRVGLLSVRGRLMDTTMLVLAGGALIVISGSLGHTG